MKLIYTGVHTEVIVPLPLGGEILVKRGVAVLLPDSLGKRLLDQPSNWCRSSK